LAGDLDNIVLKALRKEPARRYSSAEQLAEDIRRHLQGLPVTATPDSILYRAKKFARRHKAGVAAVALFLLAVFAGVMATVREARIARANQRRAEARFNDVRKLANSLMFEIHDSVQALPGATSARKIIVEKSQKYLDSLAGESAGDLSLQRELASAYEKLGDVQGNMAGSNLDDVGGAMQSYSKALGIRQAVAAASAHTSDDQLALAQVYQRLAHIRWVSLGSTEDGLKELRQALAITEDLAGKGASNTKVTESLASEYQELGDMLGGSGLFGNLGDPQAALENHRKALDLLQQLANTSPADNARKYAVAKANLAVGDDLVRSGEAEQALESYRRGEEILKPLADTGNPLYGRSLAISYTRVGDALLMVERPAEALEQYRREFRLLQVLAAANPKDAPIEFDLVTAEGDVGHALAQAGRSREGQVALESALAKTGALARGSANSYLQSLLASTEVLMGESLEQSRRTTEAEKHFLRAEGLYAAITSADRSDAEDAVNLAMTRNHLGGVFLRAGDADKGGEWYRRALAIVEPMAAARDNVEVSFALADTYAGLGAVTEFSTRKARTGKSRVKGAAAEDWYRKSLELWQKIPHSSRIAPNGFEIENARRIALLAQARNSSVPGGR
jgi:non-specific serine/threonine protein kinase/serine/threonine-protein kinase